MISILVNLKLNKETSRLTVKSMVEESKEPKRYKAEELISRFRSKEDLYRYLTQQGKSSHMWCLNL
jgi:hypothetical protein